MVITLLAACGDPRSGEVFTQGASARGAAPGKSASAKSSPVPGRGGQRTIEVRTVRGMYRRAGEVAQFRPCGAPRALDVTGTPEARYLLAERFRWSAVWQNRPMFAVFGGAIVQDTLKRSSTGASDSVVRRYFLARVDSLRTWDPKDCGGMKVTP